MRKIMPLLIVASLILTACSSSQPTVSITQAPASPTEAPATTQPSVNTPTDTAGLLPPTTKRTRRSRPGNLYDFSTQFSRYLPGW